MRNLQILLYIFVILAALFMWQGCASKSNMVHLFVSSPLDVGVYIYNNIHFLLSSTLITGLESIIGLLVATFFALGASIIVSINYRAISWILPPMVVSQVIPIITIAPLLIIVLGTGIESKVVMASIISFFPIFINAITSIRDTPRPVMDLVLIYRPSWWFKVTKIYFPLGLPSIMAGMRIGSTLAVIGAIIAEFTGAELGLGKNLFLATRRLDAELMVSSVLLSSLLGGISYLGIVLLERIVGKWYLSKNSTPEFYG